tara:strand:+ start:165 stop:437 length:273 start_codon:yes stop_codon:yes gene_type:complete
MGNQIECLLKRVERIGIVESDSPGERIRKTVLAAFAIIVGGAAVAWGVNYGAYDENLAGSIRLLYATGSFLSVAVFAVTMPVGFDPFSLF